MSDEQVRLGELRDEIDQIDQKIMELISARATCAQQVAQVKTTANPGQD
ncbi:MAG: chorismate mutase, partial [Marinobacter sp.]|nr:chorismate mutase [Marinobacter sp.]